MPLWGTILPSDPIICGSDEGFVECVIDYHRSHEEHLGRLPNGNYIRWTHVGVRCDCETDDCGCFDYTIISERQALVILNTKD
jgi:hypothetical protein